MKSIIYRAKYFNLQAPLKSTLAVYKSTIGSRSAWLSALNMDRPALEINLHTNFTLISVSQPYNYAASQDGTIYCVLHWKGPFKGAIKRDIINETGTYHKKLFIMIRPEKITFIMHDKFIVTDYYSYPLQFGKEPSRQN